MNFIGSCSTREYLTYIYQIALHEIGIFIILNEKFILRSTCVKEEGMNKIFNSCYTFLPSFSFALLIS